MRDLVLAYLNEVSLPHAKDKWPNWSKDPYSSLTVITEELGELAKALLQFQFENGHENEIRKEAFHVLTTAYRFCENLDNHINYLKNEK